MDSSKPTVTGTLAHMHLTGTVDRVEKDTPPMPRADQNHELDETAYLLRSPANAQRLIRSIAQLRAGNTVVRHVSEE